MEAQSREVSLQVHTHQLVHIQSNSVPATLRIPFIPSLAMKNIQFVLQLGPDFYFCLETILYRGSNAKSHCASNHGDLTTIATIWNTAPIVSEIQYHLNTGPPKILTKGPRKVYSNEKGFCCVTLELGSPHPTSHLHRRRPG